MNVRLVDCRGPRRRTARRIALAARLLDRRGRLSLIGRLRGRPTRAAWRVLAASAAVPFGVAFAVAMASADDEVPAPPRSVSGAALLDEQSAAPVAGAGRLHAVAPLPDPPPPPRPRRARRAAPPPVPVHVPVAVAPPQPAATPAPVSTPAPYVPPPAPAPAPAPAPPPPAPAPQPQETFDSSGSFESSG